MYSYQYIRLQIIIHKNVTREHYTRSATVNKSDVHKTQHIHASAYNATQGDEIEFKLNQNKSLSCLQYISLWIEQINQIHKYIIYIFKCT